MRTRAAKSAACMPPDSAACAEPVFAAGAAPNTTGARLTRVRSVWPSLRMRPPGAGSATGIARGGLEPLAANRRSAGYGPAGVLGFPTLLNHVPAGAVSAFYATSLHVAPFTPSRRPAPCPVKSKARSRQRRILGSAGRAWCTGTACVPCVRRLPVLLLPGTTFAWNVCIFSGEGSRWLEIHQVP